MLCTEPLWPKLLQKRPESALPGISPFLSSLRRHSQALYRWGLAAIEDNKPASKRKRCRWSDIDPEAEKQANLHAAPAIGLPNERIRCARLQGRLNEITQVMTGGSLENIDLGRPRSPSPEPTYDAHGKRTNTRDQRLRDRYTREKQEIVVEISRINPDFDASAVGAVLTFKRTAKFPIPWREYPEYRSLVMHSQPTQQSSKLITYYSIMVTAQVQLHRSDHRTPRHHAEAS